MCVSSWLNNNIKITQIPYDCCPSCPSSLSSLTILITIPITIPIIHTNSVIIIHSIPIPIPTTTLLTNTN
jgi:hypothetical protein